MNSQRKVLAVDDDITQLEVISEILDTEGIEKVLLRDPSNVIEVAEKEQPHLIIMDLYMPVDGSIEKIGFELVRLLKKNELTKKIPVIVLSSEDNKKDQLNAILFKGCEDFLEKPITREKLRDKISLYSYLGMVSRNSENALQAFQPSKLVNKIKQH